MIESKVFKGLSLLHLIMMIGAMVVGPVVGVLASYGEIETKRVQMRLEVEERFVRKDEIRELREELKEIRRDIKTLLVRSQ